MEGAYPPSFLPSSGCSVLYTVGGIARTEHDSCLHEYVTSEGGRAKKAREETEKRPREKLTSDGRMYPMPWGLMAENVYMVFTE